MGGCLVQAFKLRVISRNLRVECQHLGHVSLPLQVAERLGLFVDIPILAYQQLLPVGARGLVELCRPLRVTPQTLTMTTYPLKPPSSRR